MGWLCGGFSLGLDYGEAFENCPGCMWVIGRTCRQERAGGVRLELLLLAEAHEGQGVSDPGEDGQVAPDDLPGREFVLQPLDAVLEIDMDHFMTEDGGELGFRLQKP